MGQGASFVYTAAGPSESPVRTHYEVLGLDHHATLDDIRKSYRKRALELHPDRNPDDVEGKTRLFAELQSAYEVLSDPDTRAWYDSHLLVDWLPNASGEREDPRAPQHVFTFEDVDEFHSTIEASLQNASDFPRPDIELFFQRLAEEENFASTLAGKEPVHYPPFALCSNTDDDQLTTFYACWSSFTTDKSFAWSEKFPIHEAPDRRTRRMMEKNNQRSRDQSIRKFNLSVRSLVSSIKRRDPHYQRAHVSDSRRSEQLRHISAAQASKTRSENQAKLRGNMVPDWATRRSSSDDIESSCEEDCVEARLECLLCQKVFRSENQYASHARSKKHLKATRASQRQNLSKEVTRDAGAMAQEINSLAEKP